MSTASCSRNKAGVLTLLLVPLLVGLAFNNAEESAVVARKHVIVIEGFEYKPASLRARLGDTIVWVNRDIVPHTATADSRKWDTGNIAPNAARTVVMRRTGEQAYFCILHPSMQAKLTVMGEEVP